MDPVSLEDLALLEVLHSIDRGIALTDAQSQVRQRMAESALVAEDADGIKLTRAGIELCKSLQHRVAAYEQAEKLRQQRADAEASTNGDATGTTLR